MYHYLSPFDINMTYHDLTSTNLASYIFLHVFLLQPWPPLPQLPGDIVVGIGIRIDAPQAHGLQKSQRLLPEACIPQIDGPCQGPMRVLEAQNMQAKSVWMLQVYASVTRNERPLPVSG